MRAIQIYGLMDTRPDAEPQAELWLKAVYNADRCRCRVLIS